MDVGLNHSHHRRTPATEIVMNILESRMEIMREHYHV